MANMEQVPFEIVIEKTKDELLTSINAVGQKYEMPSSVMLMVLEQIVDEAKLGSYTALIRNIPVDSNDQNENIPSGPTPQSVPTPKPQPVSKATPMKDTKV